MNVIRRKALEDIIDHLEEVKSRVEVLQTAEEVYRDNIPERLWGSEKFDRADQVCDYLGDAIDSLEDAINSIYFAVE